MSAPFLRAPKGGFMTTVSTWMPALNCFLFSQKAGECFGILNA